MSETGIGVAIFCMSIGQLCLCAYTWALKQRVLRIERDVRMLIDPTARD